MANDLNNSTSQLGSQLNSFLSGASKWAGSLPKAAQTIGAPIANAVKSINTPSPSANLNPTPPDTSDSDEELPSFKPQTSSDAPNPVVQSYLNDNDIDYSKRQGVMQALKSGQDPNEIAGFITQKYGNKYTTSSNTQSPDQTTSNPNAQSTGQPQPAKGFQDPGTQFKNPSQYTEQDFNNSSIGKFAQAETPSLQGAMDQDASMGPLERGEAFGSSLLNGVGNTVGGAYNMVANTLGQAPAAVKAGVDLVTGNYRKNADGSPDMKTTTPEDQTAIEQSQGGINGLNQMIGGVGQTVTSPIASSPVLQKGLQVPFEAAHSALGGVLQEIAGIDPTSNSGKSIVDSALNGIMGAIVGPEKITKGITDVLPSPKEAAIPNSSLRGAGEAVFRATTPAAAREAGLLQQESAGTIDNVRTTAQSVYENNVKGVTKVSLGDNALKAAQSIWKDKIAPALENSPNTLNFQDYFDSIKAEIDKIPDPSRQADLLKAYDALENDYTKPGTTWSKMDSTKVSLSDAQEIKSGLDEFTPKKLFKGEDVAGAFATVKNMLANQVRQGIYDAIPDQNMRDSYLDYGNLKELSKQGITGRTQASTMGGSGRMAGDAIRAFGKPIGIVAGKALYNIAGKSYLADTDFYGNLHLVPYSVGSTVQNQNSQ